MTWKITLSRTRLKGGTSPVEGELGEGRKEEGDRTERTKDGKSKSTKIYITYGGQRVGVQVSM